MSRRASCWPRRRSLSHRPQPAAATTVAAPSGQTTDDFYRLRKDAPLWLAAGAGDSAEQLVSLLSTASIDGLSPDKYHVATLQAALEAARGGKRKAIERADRALSQAFVDYVRDLRQDPGVGITYVDPSLRPNPPSALAALIGAANAPSLARLCRVDGVDAPDLRPAAASDRGT